MRNAINDDDDWQQNKRFPEYPKREIGDTFDCCFHTISFVTATVTVTATALNGKSHHHYDHYLPLALANVGFG